MYSEILLPPEQTARLESLLFETVEESRNWGLKIFFLTDLPPSKCETVELLDYFALFPGLDGSFFALTRAKPEEINSFLGKITSLKLPQRLQNPRDSSPEMDKEEITASLARQSRPSLIIARVKPIDGENKQETYILFCPRGMYPQTALHIIKQAAEDKLSFLIPLSN